MAIGDLAWEEWAERHGYDVNDAEAARIYDELVAFGTGAEDAPYWDVYEGNLLDDITMGAVGFAEAVGLPLGDDEPSPVGEGLATILNIGLVLLAAYILIPLVSE